MKKSLSIMLILFAAAMIFPLGAWAQQTEQASPDGAKASDQSPRQDLADASLTARIKTAYLFNTHLNSFKINVDSEDGIVTLQGVVKSGIQKDLAGEIAKNAAGVKSVRNELKVGEGAISDPDDVDRTFSQAVIDATTTASVKTALALAKDVKATEINVSTRWGTVTLEGAVGTQAEKEKAERTAKETAGVKAVDNKIQVKG